MEIHKQNMKVLIEIIEGNPGCLMEFLAVIINKGMIIEQSQPNPLCRLTRPMYRSLDSHIGELHQRFCPEIKMPNIMAVETLCEDGFQYAFFDTSRYEELDQVARATKEFHAQKKLIK